MRTSDKYTYFQGNRCYYCRSFIWSNVKLNLKWTHFLEKGSFYIQSFEVCGYWNVTHCSVHFNTWHIQVSCSKADVKASTKGWDAVESCVEYWTAFPKLCFLAAGPLKKLERDCITLSQCGTGYVNTSRGSPSRSAPCEGASLTTTFGPVTLNHVWWDRRERGWEAGEREPAFTVLCVSPCLSSRFKDSITHDSSKAFWQPQRDRRLHLHGKQTPPPIVPLSFLCILSFLPYAPLRLYTLSHVSKC